MSLHSRLQNVFSIGSGDVFVAAFAYAWAVRNMPIVDAGRFASLSTANYVETRGLPIAPPDPGAIPCREEAGRTGGRVYLAAPFRETGQRMLVDDARSQLRNLGMSVFSPIHDIGPGVAEVVVRHDLAAISAMRCGFRNPQWEQPRDGLRSGIRAGLGEASLLRHAKHARRRP